MNEPRSTRLQYSDLSQGGTSHKEYVVELTPAGDAWLVNFQYGRIGSTLRPGTKTPAPQAYADAERTYHNIVAEKVREGYRVVSNGTEPSGPVPVPSQPLPCELLTEITESEAMALIGDDRYYMQQKMDGQRRRVIKRDGRVFGLNRKAEPVPVSQPLHDELAQLSLNPLTSTPRSWASL